MHKIDFKMIFAEKISFITGMGISQIYDTIETPPDSNLGDLAFPCFNLAKTLKKSPILIAQEMATQINDDNFEKVVNIGGYLNIFLNKKSFIENILKTNHSIKKQNEKILIEHMNANPNKPLHIGQGRNICLGDTLVRLFTYLGYKTHAVNYGDDSGVNVGYNIVGHLYYNLPLESELKYDHYCGQIYTQMIKKNEDSEFKSLLSKTLLSIEKKDNPEITKTQVDYTRKCAVGQLQTCRRLGSYFDLINWETDILHMKLFEHALDKLKNSGYIRYEDSGEAAGCWIIDLSSLKTFEKEEKKYQILIKSDGVATYTGKDIAYAMWKIGMLGKDFNYQEFIKQPNQKIVFTTTSESENISNTDFGNYNKAIAVIDNRQSFAQKVVKGSLELLGFLSDQKDYIHLSYGVVYLTPTTLETFGYELTNEEKQETRLPFSTRKGRFVTVDQTLDILKQKALEETTKRNSSQPKEWLESTAEKIAVSSLRFFLTKTDHNKDITFDLNEVLDMEGETGAYALYTYARLQNILKQVDINSLKNIDTSLLTENIEFEIIKLIDKLDTILDEAQKELSPYILCRYTIELCKIFNSYYANFSILKEEESTKNARLLLLKKISETLKILFDLIGIQEVERM